VCETRVADRVNEITDAAGARAAVDWVELQATLQKRTTLDF
jgi:hypothetical protein